MIDRVTGRMAEWLVYPRLWTATVSEFVWKFRAFARERGECQAHGQMESEPSGMAAREAKRLPAAALEELDQSRRLPAGRHCFFLSRSPRL
ncbi:hypothetical protein PC116_g13514 [Phytophthora cactorum]|uniref:Uncharacterized protein n=1 Tax=Phytophthora cactorum TaxID=29920 RepID=A0A8T1KSN7_9STRA|nr:hypothetical protein Pcac1_g4784 [Phytophthora cactorum]KAG2908704.1 hypothetical protein PC114_g10339 [Phytophthora cactorum]KAG2945282.1 hypothetical protein PC117_g8585 [Phytophthora cactorum]KAG3029543.1 hypothetical protein PC119_g6583 [Phytophthora cactorum]KAG3195453.1 hypothetical protein PC128_g8474 [Phytophthora cactorum]